MLLKNTCIEGKASKEIRKYCKLKKNENIKYQNLWDAVKIVLQEKLMAINIYIRKKEQSQINDLGIHLRKIEKE